MARVWNAVQDVAKAVNTITALIRETGTLPEPLVRAYWESLEKASRGLVQRFYEGLAERCPEALRFFAEKPIEMDLEEEGQA